MQRIVALIALAILLVPASVRCAEDEVISVGYADLPKLWTQVRGNTRGDLVFPAKYRVGCARFSFIVEADGAVSTIKILGTFPDSEFGLVAERMLKQWRFEATALNAERTPAYTEHTMVWVAPGADRVLGSNRREKISPNRVANQCALASMRGGD
jgi:hypothetical protein